MKHKKENENCVVCGARTRFDVTCDSICTRARKTGRTRAGQISAEIHAADRAARARDLGDRLMLKTIRQAADDFDYNRPYMRFAV